MAAARYADARSAPLGRNTDSSGVQFAPKFKPYLPCLSPFPPGICIHTLFLEHPSYGRRVQPDKFCISGSNCCADCSSFQCSLRVLPIRFLLVHRTEVQRPQYTLVALATDRWLLCHSIQQFYDGSNNPPES